MSKEIDNAIVSHKTYANENKCDLLFAKLRKESPVYWAEPDDFRPFWVVTKYADIQEIERQNDRFLSSTRSVLSSITDEEKMRALTGSDAPMVRALVNMDDPEHRTYRDMTQTWFMPRNLKSLEAEVTALAHEYIDRMEDMGGECDFVNDIAIWYPLRVIMMILGLPREDEKLMMKLTQETFGPKDPDMQPDEATQFATMMKFFEYFTAVTEDRRKSPRNDVASTIANAKINGEYINPIEAIGYYLIIATAGHDTTSSTTAGGMLAMMENPSEFAKLKANPSPDMIQNAIEEMLRYVSPVKHFFRTPTEDYVLRGQKIKAGESMMMCYASANRDEEAFKNAGSFIVDRSPNRHIAFGHGVHICLGMHLARMEMRVFYKELMNRLEHIELAGEPAWVESSLVSGLKRLPVRYRMKRKAA